QADGLRPDASLALLLRGHLPVRGRGRMAGEGLRIAQVHEALEELQRVIEACARIVAPANGEGEERAGTPAEVLLAERIVRVVGKTHVAPRIDARIGAQKLRHPPRVFHVPLDAQRYRLDALHEEEGIER